VKVLVLPFSIFYRSSEVVIAADAQPIEGGVHAATKFAYPDVHNPLLCRDEMNCENRGQHQDRASNKSKPKLFHRGLRLSTGLHWLKRASGKVSMPIRIKANARHNCQGVERLARNALVKVL
jgi:hypothetical protein